MNIDLGLQRYELPGGALRFNPTDPALYLRLEQLEDKLKALSDLEPGDFDRQAKALLNWVLGPGNDVDRAVSGVSLLAVGSNGKTVLLNLLEALAPILQEGAEACAAIC